MVFFQKGLTTAGSALVDGKVTLFNNYIANSVGTVDNFTHWNNLMGDPFLICGQILLAKYRFPIPSMYTWGLLI